MSRTSAPDIRVQGASNRSRSGDRSDAPLTEGLSPWPRERAAEKSVLRCTVCSRTNRHRHALRQTMPATRGLAFDFALQQTSSEKDSTPH
eukprot:2930021-Rhodomonas_salina.1